MSSLCRQVKGWPSSYKEVSPPNDDCGASLSYVSLVGVHGDYLQHSASFHESVVGSLTFTEGTKPLDFLSLAFISSLSWRRLMSPYHHLRLSLSSYMVKYTIKATINSKSNLNLRSSGITASCHLAPSSISHLLFSPSQVKIFNYSLLCTF